MSALAPKAMLYAIPGSHSCASAILMLEHKHVAYRRVDLLTGLHPIALRMHGFSGHRTPIRMVDGRTHRSLAALDRLGTVPALRFADHRVQGSREIARFLDDIEPRPPLFPADENQRRAVEEAERFGDEELQMAARRIVLARAQGGLDGLYGRGNYGRLGPLLAKNERVRAITNRISAQFIFRASPASERELLDALPAMLDRVDTWIGEGLLGGEELNAADMMIVPSLALLAYRLDLRSEIQARAAGALLERVLPER